MGNFPFTTDNTSDWYWVKVPPVADQRRVIRRGVVARMRALMWSSGILAEAAAIVDQAGGV